MASYTSNLNLKKPALTDDALVTDLNDNSDKLDAAISAGSGAIAIVSVGNTHAAISSGQYVYVRQHGSLSEGLYKATTNIAANGTLSGSNLTAVSGGGLNSVYSALSDQIANLIKYVDISCTTTGDYNTVSYPTGFNKNSCNIIGVEKYNSGNYTWYYNTDNIMLGLLNDGIGIYVPSTSDVAYGNNYRVGIAKI